MFRGLKQLVTLLTNRFPRVNELLVIILFCRFGLMIFSLLVRIQNAAFLTCLTLVSLLALGSIWLRHRAPRESASFEQPALRWLVASEPSTLSWLDCRDVSCRAHLSLVMQGLSRLTYSHGRLSAQPALAEQWDSPSPTHLHITLRTLSWSNGEPLTSLDIVSSWRQLLTHCHELTGASLLFPISGARAFCNGTIGFDSVGIHATSAKELEIDLESTRPGFIEALSEPPTWPFFHGQPTSLPSTIGPYTLEKWGHDKSMRYVRNALYRGGENNSPAAIEVRVEPSARLRVELFLAGEADLADDIPEDLVPEVGQSDQVLVGAMPSIVALELNPAKHPFNQLSMRRWFMRQFDREELLRLLEPSPRAATALLPTFDPYAQPSRRGGVGLTGIFSELSIGESSRQDEETESPAELSHPVSLALGSGHDPDQSLLDATFADLQAQWARSGMGILQGERSTSSLDSADGRLTVLSLDPLRPQAVIDQAVAGSGSLWPRWRNNRLDRFERDLARDQDPSVAEATLEEAAEYVLSDRALILPLFFRPRFFLKSSKLDGVRLAAHGELDLSQTALN